MGATTYITVLDNGFGVPSGRQDTIFDLYKRGHDARSTDTAVGSVGVGLAVARQLAHLMDGELDYDYSGGWSRFRLSLPAVSVMASDRPDPVRKESHAIVTYVAFGRTAS